MNLKIRYDGRPRPWARPQTFRTKTGRIVRAEDKTRHWSRTAFNAMVKLWNQAWLASPNRNAWDATAPMHLSVIAHFDGREGGFLEAELVPVHPSFRDERYTGSPDIDNVVKLCVEAAQKSGVLKNDSQVVVMVAQKNRGGGTRNAGDNPCE